MRIETERLFLREMNMDDFEALYAVLGDREMIGMQFEKEYPDENNGITHVSVIRRDEFSQHS